MPRAKRIHLENALYYVTNKGVHGQSLFNDREDYLMYIDLLKKYKAQLGFKLFAFSLMANHVHLLMETSPDITLSEVMHNITSAYTKYYNKKYARQGHLFRGRFKATIIEKEPNLLRLTRYVHLNSKQLNLAQDPKDYPYSSYLYYTHSDRGESDKIDLTQEVREVVAYLGERNYEDYMKGSVGQENIVLHKELHRSVYLGSEEFGRMIQERLKEDAQEESKVVTARPKNLALPLISGVMLAAIAASALVYTQKIARKVRVTAAEQKSVAVAPAVEPEIPFDIVGLDGTLWQIKFVAGTPFQTVDILKFDKGRMSSENLDLNSYPSSNYSMTKEAGRVIWETMQTSSSGTASWRGEVESGKMRGVLSLRQDQKEPQDFSFVSLKYKKI